MCAPRAYQVKPPRMSYLLIFLSQVAFNVLKVLEIRFTYENNVGRLILNSVFINLVALLSVYYSIELLLEKRDYLVILFYISGSVLGKYLGLRGPNPRVRIWDRLFRQDRKQDDI